MLLLDNEQTELTAIEKGKHAYEHIGSFDHEGGRGKTGGVSEYARTHGFKKEYVHRWLGAYKVAKTVTVCNGLENISYLILYEISKAAEIAWRPLVETALDEDWTQIVELYLRGWNTQEDIAESFDVTRQAVGNIIDNAKKTQMRQISKGFKSL